MSLQIPTKVIHDTQVTILGGKESQARRDQFASVVLIFRHTTSKSDNPTFDYRLYHHLSIRMSGSDTGQ
jgi:hypothetical protein